MNKTIGQKLADHKGFGPGFDLLRITLSVAVVAWHCVPIATASIEQDRTAWVWLPGYAILSMFFALSGFLITGSAQRLRLSDFMLNRGLRIFPALIVEIALSAIIFGAIFTSLPLKEYFSSPGTWHYFMNVVGRISYLLPGVFQSNPTPVINASLWTIPFEIGCYIIMAGLMILGFLKYPWLVVAGGASVIVIGLIMDAFVPTTASGASIQGILTILFQGRGSRLYVSFLFGIAVYLYRDRIPYSHWLAGACCLWCVVLAGLGPSQWTFPQENLLLAVPIVYLTSYLGVTRFPEIRLYDKADYSYGIYLYGFAIQQAVIAVVPWVKSPLLLFVISMPLITLFSAFSWHVIEKPILKLRKNFSFVATKRLRSEYATDSTEPPVSRQSI